jgi:hypothetical protein
MESVQVKVLTHNNQFVDNDLLYKGCYATQIPLLYKPTMTMEKLLRNYHKLMENAKKSFDYSYEEKIKNKIANLAHCELNEYTLTKNK